MHPSTQAPTQLLNLLTLLQTKQTLEALETYKEFCYNFYLLATYEEQIEDNTEKQICYITFPRSHSVLGGIRIQQHKDKPNLKR